MLLPRNIANAVHGRIYTHLAFSTYPGFAWQLDLNARFSRALQVQGRIDDIHQVGRAARNIVTRPSRLLGMLQRQSSKDVRLTDSEDPGSDTDDGGRRRQLLPVVGSASDSTSNNSQQRLASRSEYVAPTEQTP